jgi:transposase
MDKITTIFGIDISKDYFDVWNDQLGHKKFSNNSKGFREFKKCLSDSSWCVMEYTACYYQRLALFLKEHNFHVSVINPLKVKRFIQMKFQNNKTDKSDAKLIAKFGIEQDLEEWLPKPSYIEECNAIHSTISLYFKQSTSMKNKIHSFKSKGGHSLTVQSLKRQLRHLKQEIAKLETELEQVIKKHEPDLLCNLQTIPGIGKKTALLLISSSNAFKTFTNYRQLSAFFGLAPCEHSSGSSVKGKSRISKRGNAMVRNHLFLCSFTACKRNKACSAIYNRLLNKGKSKKLALIAVCNKLIKQSFSIAKSGLPYDPAYRSAYVYQ